MKKFIYLFFVSFFLLSFSNTETQKTEQNSNNLVKLYHLNENGQYVLISVPQFVANSHFALHPNDF